MIQFSKYIEIFVGWVWDWVPNELPGPKLKTLSKTGTIASIIQVKLTADEH